MDRASATRQAKRAVGSLEPVKEHMRDVQITRWVRDFGRDFRYGLRALRRAPGFTLHLGPLSYVFPMQDHGRTVVVAYSGGTLTGAFGTDVALWGTPDAESRGSYALDGYATHSRRTRRVPTSGTRQSGANASDHYCDIEILPTGVAADARSARDRSHVGHLFAGHARCHRAKRV
jgi:hypothetical protein